MRLVLAALLVAVAWPSAAAAATCAPVSTDARILASADYEDIHRRWADGSRIGLSWSLDLTGEEEGAGGEYYLIGDLIDPRGNVVDRDVYVHSMEWECDAE